MAARAYWKGYLKLSLVTCPVALVPATSTSEKTHFHQISRKTGHRLRQQMVDEETGKVVSKEDKGRGYELSKGQYVEIEPEELEAIEFENTHSLEITSFVPVAEIDKRYFDRPYYVVPDSASGEEAFVVIRDAMKHEERIALATVVFANRQHLIALEPWGKGILGTTLRFEDEVRSEGEFFKPIKSFKADRSMVDIASHILAAKAGHFEPDKFKDKYEDGLKALVKRKAAGKPIEQPQDKPAENNVVSLMDALQRSMAMTKGGSRSKKVATKKVGARRKRARTSARVRA